MLLRSSFLHWCKTWDMIDRDCCKKGYQKFEVHKLMAAADTAKRSSFLTLAATNSQRSSAELTN